MMSRMGFAALIVFTLALVQFFPLAAIAESRQIVVTEDNDYFGFDLETEKDVTLEQCKSSCLSNQACLAFTYNTSAQFCFLKSDFSKISSFKGAVAGRIISTSGEPDLGAPPKLSYLPTFILGEAQTFRNGLNIGKPLPDTTGFLSMIRVGNQNYNTNTKTAIDGFYTALRIDADNVGAWLKLSAVTQSHISTKSSDKQFYQRMATSSAYNAYLLSRSQSKRAEALALLARGLRARNNTRPALTAFKQSLALREVPVERAAYSQLLSTHGFRVLNHTINSDNLSPRVCVQFSEKLQSSATDYTNYLTVNRKTPQAIDVKSKQICIEGLSHGKTYQIGLREGLPSTIGENLQTNVNLNIYIRDRKSAARFTGSNFVLPLSARRGIPIVTVNAISADLKLYRIGERALSTLISDSKFLRQLQNYQIDYLMESLGEPIWNGQVDITPDLNKEVTTSIPIDKALPTRKPGVYLLTAAASKSGPQPGDNIASQWFVISDIGLTTFNGNGNMRVVSRSLSTAKPLVNTEVTLIAHNNEILGTAITNGEGEAIFDAGLTRGKQGLAPAAVTAKTSSSDFIFLDISRPGFDFTDRGVRGRAAPAGVDVYAWTERGIYRTGETVHVAALARDATANAIDGLPLTFVFRRPDGMEDRRIINKGEDLGGYSVQLPLTNNAKRGTWQLQVYTDPKKNPVAEQMFLVEDFLPERTDFEIIAPQNALAIGETGSVKIKGRYLYGAPASGLKIDGELIVSTKRQREGFKGYLFGLASEKQTTNQYVAINNMPPLNADGESVFNVALKNTHATTRPQSANLVVRMREGSGRAVERKTSVNIVPQQTMIGIKPDFDDGQTGENTTSEFSIIAVDPSGNRTQLSGTEWSLVKIERNYQWYRNGSSWNYESFDVESKVANGEINIGENQAAKLQLPVKWGHYRLEVRSNSHDGLASSVDFNAGWYVETKSTQTPDGLEIALDKLDYKIGDIAKLKVSPRYGGELLIAIGTDSILKTMSVSVPASGSTIDIPVEEDWGAGAYVLATLYRPGNAGNSRLPMRAIGVKWLSVAPEERALSVSLDLPEQSEPHNQFTIPVHVGGLKPGEEAYVSIAAVDVGILNLTNYKSPDPVARYFGQRQLGIGMRDIYGRLINGYLGTTGRLRTGGDGSDGMSSDGSPPTEKLVAFFKGPVRLDDNGDASVSFDIPQFNGSIRVMATAWTANGVGSSDAETIIREPMVISASLPKFMAPGDQARLLIEIANTDAPSGTYWLGLESSENLSFSQEGLVQALDLPSGEKSKLIIPVSAISTGEGWARIILSHADGFSIEHDIAMPVRPGSLPITRKLNVALNANGGSLVIDKHLLAGSNLDGAKINVSVARPSAIDVPSLLLQLNKYPYGCAEQTASKALPLLYASEFKQGIPGFDDVVIKARIQKAIDKVLSYQSNSGGFSLWGNGADDLWLGAYVSDFLTRAIEKGYDVPAEPMKQALNNLQNVLAYQNDLAQNSASVAYALYVLARNKQASAGDLRYYADTQLSSFKSPIARAQLAASMALYGDQQRAESTFSSAFSLAQKNSNSYAGRYVYGSNLRDAAAMLALASESTPEPSNINGMRQLISALNFSDEYTNTQEQAWLLLAARAAKSLDSAITLEVDGQPHQGTLGRRIEGSNLANQPLRVTNTFEKELQATITTVAVPDQPLPAGGNGFTISRTYYQLDGSEANVSQVEQNERFVVVLKIKQLQDLASRIIVTDLLPAGFEIDNPRLVGSADLKNFNWLPSTVAAHSDFRSDRFIGAFNRAKGTKSEFTVAYTVRAVTPGTFTHPAATIEDMYRPELSARTSTGWMQVNAPR